MDWFLNLMDKLTELEFVFQENTSDKTVPFERCLHNLSDYIEALSIQCSKDCDQQTQRAIVTEIERNLTLLRHKAIDPNNVYTNFVIWKKET
jgi:hypothetical protein